MAQTVFGTNDPKTVKKWSTTLAVDQRKKSYFETRMIGTSENNIIQRKTELEGGPGDSVSFDLSIQLRGGVTYGDDRLEGKEEQLKFYTDQVKIDQVRKAVSAGGRMTRKRVAHDLRAIARNRLGDYFAKYMDELLFIYLSGARGINADFIEKTDYTGFAGNTIDAPDAGHILYGGSATSKATLAAGDTMTRQVIERANTKAEMLQAQNPDSANMQPYRNADTGQYVCLMNPFQAYALRTDTGTGNWLDVQKAAAAAQGNKNPIFIGNLGMIDNTILHSHRNGIRFSDYGAGSNVAAGRALYMGAQAGVIAYGTKGGMRYMWQEMKKDYENEPTVASGFIGGLKKARFNNQDFGVISIDTAAKDPNS